MATKLPASRFYSLIFVALVLSLAPVLFGLARVIEAIS